MKDRGVWVYDIETIKNCFTLTAINVNTEEIVKFVLHSERDDLNDLINHLEKVKLYIGFNNIAFDGQVIQFILNSLVKWKNNKLNIETIVTEIYSYAQEVIENSNLGLFPEFKEWELTIKQLDLYKIKHFDNKAKIQSLKGLEFWMKYPNVQDMPIKHSESVDISQINEILDYNLNDVLATYEFYKLCKSEIELREDLSKEFNLNLLNANDPKIGAEIFAKLLSEDMKMDKKDLKQLRTYRSSINIGEIILPYIKFKSQEFNKLLDSLKNKIITETKGSLDHSIIYKQFKYDFGAGGIHGCIEPGTYKLEEGYIIEDIDVSSFYPNLAIVNGFRPEHLGESFNRIYKYIYDERKKIPKKDPRNAAYKLMLNGVYGKSNSKYSYLYDPKFTMSITINGQLLIALLAETLVDETNCQVLQVNTDGITIKYKDCHKDLVKEICNNWCSLTGLDLEYALYNQMTIMDVNNYIGVYTDNKVKYKGLFELTKESHKDTSFNIVPLALSNYFIKNISIEDTIKTHKDIYDFCGKAKFKGKDYGITEYIKKSKFNNEDYYEKIREKQQKTTRYYISTNGATFVKIYNKGSEEFINKGYLVTIFNKYKEQKDYLINYSFYINECYKILNIIEPKQLKLF